MHFLAWLAAEFAHTVKHASRTSPSLQQQLSQQAATSLGASVPLSADFYFFATLLQPLLQHMQTGTPSPFPPYSTTAAVVAINTTVVGEGPAALPKQAAAVAASATKQRKGQKGRAQGVQESHGLPADWAVAAQGAASLVPVLLMYHSSLCT